MASSQLELKTSPQGQGKPAALSTTTFRDKEDVFFAILEEDIARDQERVIEELAAATDLDARIDVLAEHLEELLRDKQRVLLNLEFKIYVIRHPQKRKRLSRLYAEMSSALFDDQNQYVVPELVGAVIEKRQKLSMEVGAVIDGLALNSLFNPEALTGEQRKRYLRLVAKEALQAARET